MSQIPSGLRYTESHEWLREHDDGTLSVGITDHAQDALGDIVFLELPELGRDVQAGEACAVIESVKAASDIYAPISGRIVAINEALPDTPEAINGDPYQSWLFRIEPASDERPTLLDPDGYAAAIG